MKRYGLFVADKQLQCFPKVGEFGNSSVPQWKLWHELDAVSRKEAIKRFEPHIKIIGASSQWKVEIV